MITILNSPLEKYTHILHVADIHIRLNKRHDEYREVFSKLYEEAKVSPPGTVVALLGDIFHSKSDLSPECVQMASELLKNLADIRPTILVAGNHDCTLSNKSRLDSLTPVVDALNHQNLFYLKTTSLYGFGNILWNNMCVFDDPEKYIRGTDIPSLYRNQYDHIVALFHGPMDQAALDTGYSISNPAIMPPLFDWNDIALLGDIHKKQDMQAYDENEHKPCIHYVGSLIQQNHGETLKNHGYSLWDLKTNSYEFHEIKNDYGYFTVEVNKGQLTTDIGGIPAKTRLRVKCFESIASEVKAVISKVKEFVQVIEVAHLRMDQVKDKKDIIPLCKDIVLGDLTSVTYQNRLITEFLQKKLSVINPDKITSILEINKYTNGLIKRDDFPRNLKWKPIRFEFNNMFAYGENNVIDFTQMDGVYGIFGPNKSGKSSILSAILFCLFDKFDRGFKGAFVLNSQKTSFKCKLEFEISGVRYFIERTGNTTRTGNVKVDVEFWRVVNGVVEELHGTARRDTNDVIRDYVGTYEDFVQTAASFAYAKDYVPFIDMGNSERKDLLVQFMGLNVFDRLHEAAGERNKELNTLLKLHKNKNYSIDIQQSQIMMANAIVVFDGLAEQIESLRKQIAGVNEQIVLDTANLIKLDNDVPTNLKELEIKKTSIEKCNEENIAALKGFQESLSKKETTVTDLNVKVKEIEDSNLVESHQKFKDLNNKITLLKQEMELKKIEIRGRLEKAKRLESHKYDPKCKFCVDNDFVRDAVKAKEDLKQDKIDADKMWSNLEDYREQLEVVAWVDKAYEKYTAILVERSKVKDECALLSRNIIVTTNNLEKLSTSLKGVVDQISIYHRNEVSVEANIKVQERIASYRKAHLRLEQELQKCNKDLMDVSGKKELYKNQIETLTKTLAEVAELENESDSYQLYLQSVGRDGIPYQVICNAVPEIEKEVNALLSQVVDFTIQFETDGKNIVPYMVYDYGRWAVELSSGYERFVASVALRVGLTNVSNLPKTSFLAIDEGFGALDPDNLASMHTLFSFLKNNFDFIWVISHLDALKDAVDKQIEIVRDGNLTKVIFE